MAIKRFLILALFTISSTLIFGNTANSSQQDTIAVQSVMKDTVLLAPSYIYFEKDLSLNRDFNYENSNRLKSLKIQQRTVNTLSWIVGAAAMYAVMMSTLTDNVVSMTWAIPAGVAVGGGGLYFMNRWSKNLRKKIDIIESANVYSYSVNDHIELDAVRFSVHDNTQQYGYGLSLKFNW